MSIQKNKPEQIVTVLRQIEVQMANGKTVPQACKEAGIHTQTFYRWRKEYGGLKLEQAKRMKELEKENTRRRRTARVWLGSTGNGSARQKQSSGTTERCWIWTLYRLK